MELPQHQAQVFTDDEDEQDLNNQIEKEKEYLNKQAEFIPEEKFKDMGMLFGMPEEEVQAIAEKQKTQIQKMKDESALFGEGVEEFSAQEVKAEVQNEHIMEPENEKPAENEEMGPEEEP